MGGEAVGYAQFVGGYGCQRNMYSMAVSRCALGLGQTADALLGMHSLATGRGGACHVFIRRTGPGLPPTNLAQDLD